MDTGASGARGESWGGGKNVGTGWVPAPTPRMEEGKQGSGALVPTSPGLGWLRVKGFAIYFI